MKLFVLLGAGASIPYFPGTGQITTELRKWDMFREPPLTGADQGSVWTTIMDKTSAARPYYEALFQFAKVGFNNPDVHLHFERLVQIALQLETFTVIEKAVDEFRPLLLPFVGFRENVAHFDLSAMNSIIASNSCIHILDLIADRHTPALEDRLRNCSLNGFLNDLVGKEIHSRLFSLNYDTMPLYSSLSFETGFEKPDGANFEVFSPRRFFDWEGEHLYCQLHGSTLFGYPSKGHEHESPPGLIARYNDTMTARKNRSMSTGKGHRQDGSPAATNLMITGLRKADDILSEPYASYFHRMFNEMISADAWLIVGYGGGDTHVNYCIKRAQHLMKQRQQHLKMAWVGYAPDEDFHGDDATCFEPWLGVHERCHTAIEAVVPVDCLRLMLNGRVTQSSLHWIKRNEVQTVHGETADVLLSFRGSETTFKDNSSEIFDFLTPQKKSWSICSWFKK
jgi:hypothetical protein